MQVLGTQDYICFILWAYICTKEKREKERETESMRESPTAKLRSSLAMLSSKPKSKTEIIWPADPLENNRKQGQGQIYYHCVRPL